MDPVSSGMETRKADEEMPEGARKKFFLLSQRRPLIRMARVMSTFSFAGCFRAASLPLMQSDHGRNGFLPDKMVYNVLLLIHPFTHILTNQ